MTESSNLFIKIIITRVSPISVAIQAAGIGVGTQAHHTPGHNSAGVQMAMISLTADKGIYIVKSFVPGLPKNERTWQQA
jgi:hypothetical protein